MTMRDKLRYLAVLALTAPFAAFAEGNAFTMDTTAASSAVTEIKSKIVSFFSTDLIPAVLAILGVGLGLWLVLYAVKKFRSGAGKAG